MNRIVLIGNGFDLAHGLKTSYADFIDWYWEEWGKRLRSGKRRLEEDHFCSFNLNYSIHVAGWYLVWSNCVKMNPARPWTIQPSSNLNTCEEFGSGFSGCCASSSSRDEIFFPEESRIIMLVVSSGK